MSERKWQKTEKQREATRLVADHTHSLLYGGARSGKSALGVYLTFIRAAKCPNSRHSIARQIFRDAVNKLGLDTIPTVLDLAFPDLPVHLDRSKWYWTLPNQSEVWLNGLDDAGDRDARILGSEYSTMMYDECDQIAYQSLLLARTRLAQKNDLTNREIFCCNPPAKSSWVYRLFVEKIDPSDRKQLKNPDNYGYIKLNPADNLDNIDPNYLQQLEMLPRAQRDRFLFGEWGNDSQTQLFEREWFGNNRVDDLPANLNGDAAISNIIVAIDPAGTANRNSDETGIVVLAQGVDGHSYILHSEGAKLSPEGWGRKIVDLYTMWGCSTVVAEVNFGADLIKSTIRNVDPAVHVTEVRASRGKSIRAEPISALYEQGMVHHVGDHDQLEDEMMTFDLINSPKDSPNIGDACIWGITHLTGGKIITRPMVGGKRSGEENFDEKQKEIGQMSIQEVLAADELWEEI